MRFGTVKGIAFDNIFGILNAYPGDDEVYIKNLDNGEVSKINTTVSACEMLRGELFGVEGVADAKIYDKSN